MPPRFTYGFHDGRYSPAIEDERAGLGTNPPIWTSGPQPVPHPFSEQVAGFAKFGAGVGALALLGKMRFSPQTRGFDIFTGLARRIEEYSPGRVFRTFQVSHMLSVLETPSLQKRYFSPALLSQLRMDPAGKEWLDHVSRLVGKSEAANRMINQGFRFEGGRLLLGKTGGEVLLRHAGVIRAPTGAAPQFQAAYARSLARGPLPGATTAFTSKIKYLDEAGKLHQEVFMFTGGKSRLQAARRFLFGYGTSLVERINRLAKAPAEMPVIRDIVQKIPGIKRLNLGIFGVVPSSGLKTFAKITAKLGIAVPAAIMAYKQLDYYAREAEILDETILAEGITAGAATAWTKAQMGVSQIAETFGGHDYREWQEEMAPGSTELSRLLAFPIMGALGGLAIGYGGRVARLSKYRRAGLDIGTASLAAGAEDVFFRRAIHGGDLPAEFISAADKKTIQFLEEQTTKKLGGWQGRLAQRLAKTQERGTILGRLSRIFGKLSPTKMKTIAGAGMGLALIAPFIPGALVPSKRPEELERMYTGEELVPIRKGRWWEFGRCLIKSTTCKLYDGEEKKAEDIKVGDCLVGRDHQPAVVKTVYSRKAKEQVYEFSVAIDRDIKTTLTGKHIVPILRGNNVLEVEVRNILLNEFVEVPYKPLERTVDSVNSLDYIKFPVVIKDSLIYSAQRNWATRKWQKSGKYSVPLNVELDYDMGLFFGYFLAEGNISFAKDTPSFIETVHSIHEKHIRDDVIRIAKEKFGVNGTYRFKKDGPKAKEGCYVVRLCSSILAKLFYGLFFDEPYNADDKYIRDIFDNAPELFHKGIIEGYWGGDGWLDRTSRIIGSSRKWLLIKTQLYLLNIGKPCGIGPKEENDHKGDWSLRFASDAPAAAVKFHRGRLYARVREIKAYKYNDIVYDFEVDHPDHLYQAGTFLVHNSPWEGQRITRYREHWYPRMLARARETAIWGEEPPSPLEQWWIENFSYELEKKHYYSRPYGVTGTAFEDVPFIGPLLAGTIGRLIKPPRLMHSEQFMRPAEEGAGEGSEYLQMPPRFGEKPPLTELGETTVGAPISPLGAKNILGEQAYRLSEMVGLPGFTMTAIKEAITGRQDLFDQEMRMETARRMYGRERSYWDLELGGIAGLSEIWRRLYPHRRRQISEYNPIRNLQPQWMPGPGEKSPNFLVGDPYVKVPEGEMRLAGPGYAALHPELRGVAPEDYPIIHRFRILGDVAPYTDKYKQALIQVRAAAKRGQLDPEEIEMYKETVAQVAARKVRREFTPYKYRERRSTPIERLLAMANEDQKQPGEEPSWFEETLGTYWEQLAHGAETPFEYLTPISPASKLVHMRTAVEDYERNQVQGTQNAFWGHPIRDFFRPFGQTLADSMGFEGIPEHVQERRSLEEHFDLLKYVKFTRLKRAAQAERDEGAVKEYESKRRETLFGINPYTYNFSHILRSLPRRDRDYFNEFVKADMEERAKIFEMIPENERSLYIARWKLKDAEDLKKAVKKGLLTDKQVVQAEQEINALYREKEAEGFPKTQELWAEYLATRMRGESYPDWYRRTKLLAKELEGRVLPGPSWLGYSPAVDLDDIKLKIVEKEARNTYDYDLWPDRQRAVARRPFIEPAAEALEGTMTAEETRARIMEVLSANNVSAAHVAVVPLSGDGKTTVDLQLDEDRTGMARSMVRKGDLN